ncbi:MAG TPA: YdbH domain-containing protein [Patescibacteria group bacterium]|nr:YdbH domain-containing protein [Patescibacteria group bacterium]
MKRLSIFFIIVVLCAGAVAVALPTVAAHYALGRLRSVFPGAQVTIGGCRHRFAGWLAFSDINIKKGRLYAFCLKQLRIDYSLPLLLRGVIPEVVVQGGSVNITTPGQQLSQFSKQLVLGSGRGASVQIASCRVSDIDWDIDTQDWQCKGSISVTAQPLALRLVGLRLACAYLQGQGLRLDDVFLKVDRGSSPGEVRVERLKYNKVKIEQIKGTVELTDRLLSFKSVTGQALGGSLTADLDLQIDKNPSYRARLSASQVALERITGDLELGEKVQMRGKFSGALELAGQNLTMHNVTGGFSLTGGAGNLTIKDTDMLQRLAQNNQQSMDILVENFKDYNFDTGVVKLFLDTQGDLVLAVDLEGKAGKRNLEVVVHDMQFIGKGAR